LKTRHLVFKAVAPAPQAKTPCRVFARTRVEPGGSPRQRKNIWHWLLRSTLVPDGTRGKEQKTRGKIIGAGAARAAHAGGLRPHAAKRRKEKDYLARVA